MDPENTQREFVAVYDEFSDAIFRYCYIQTSDRDIARDLTQDTFMKAWEYLVNVEHTRKKIEYMKAFLYKIATNLIIDYRRKKKPTVSLETLMEEGFDVGTPEKAQEKHEIVFEGEEAIKTLSQLDEKYRDVLTMRYVDDLSIKEIAEITGETENNVSVRIHRGLEKLRELVAR
ncbi:hypothetical protein A3A09_03460 [Candidatus Nomurabacteria bacterium RIFCSPLOWO2_01_FULL_42_20]|uniref:RNA polymerase sigma factor n=1 Tax=Candidatus Nomurabacteria bacterium RIFCSPHIGHO2_01_FULL_42_16 TaxID=1801743 RepID=A0A1F6VJR2_9BACT|nr:MAG: hypothetical protein A2824_01520 [Candidatus Nomurabacteria bacterium RIFCSPHIGHO2_01_FULL_42_16]OGI91442.1 MAG: hypothetical protein A3A09_03460 [Candidatus Nomurabacteria bacterium RIFCSPLOWO2_01_FULL_42_20]